MLGAFEPEPALTDADACVLPPAPSGGAPKPLPEDATAAAKLPTSWTSGGDYYTAKAGLALGGIDSSSSDVNSIKGLNSIYMSACCEVEPLNGGVCLGSTNACTRAAATNRVSRFAAPTAPFTNACGTQLLNNTLADSWAASTAMDAPKIKACTDGKHFDLGLDADDTSLLVTGVAFYSASADRIATANVVVTLGDKVADQPAIPDSEVSVPVPSGSHLLAALKNLDVVGRVGPTAAGVAGSGITRILSDRKVSCASYGYAVQGLSVTNGAGNGSDTIHFNRCRLPKQTLTCPCGDTPPTCDDSDRCGWCTNSQKNNCRCCFLNAAACTCKPNGCTNGSSVDSSLSRGALVHRRTDITFAVPVANGDDFPKKDTGAICEWDGSGQSCLLLNGVVDALPKGRQAQSLYAKEPSPFSVAGSVGSTYLMPVRFSLFNRASHDAGDFSDWSYLARLLNCQCAGAAVSTATCCVDYTQSNGFQFFRALYGTMQQRVPVPRELQYKQLVTVYYGYVAVQYYFLALFGYTSHLSPLGVSRYSLFYDDAEWGFTAEAFQVANVTDNQQFFSFMDDGLFQDARPVLAPFDPGTDTITVQLTVPSILFPLLFGTDATFSKVDLQGVEWLMARLFPESELISASSSGGVQPKSYFDAAGSASAQSITNPSRAPRNPLTTPFVCSSAALRDFYWFSYTPPAASRFAGDLGAKSGAYDSKNPPAGTPLLAVRVSCVMKLLFPVPAEAAAPRLSTPLSTRLSAPLPAPFPAPFRSLLHPEVKEPPSPKPAPSGARVCSPAPSAASLTLLFYLSYLQQNGGAGIPALCNGMFSDAVAQKASVNALPAAVDWPQACDLLKQKSCDPNSAAALLYEGLGAINVNSLFLTPDSGPCQCLGGSNLPPGTPGAQMNAGAMCFNSHCARPFCLSNVLSNAGQASCGTGVNNAQYDCSQHCKAYIDTVHQHLADVDFDSINLTALDEKCDFDMDELLAPLPPKPLFLAAVVLGGVAVPFLYGVVALVCAAMAAGGAGPAFAKSTAADSRFWGPCIAMALLLAGAAAFVGTQMRGTQACRAPKFTPGNYSEPSSECLVGGGVWSWIYGPAYLVSLPQSFCIDEERSYCQWWLDNNNTNRSCANGSPLQCQQKARRGVCAASTTKPYSGRPLAVRQTTQRWSPLNLLLCVAMTLAAVPAAVAGCWLGSARIPSVGGRVALTLTVGLLTLAGCFALMFLQLLFPAKFTNREVMVGPCGALAGYPDLLASVGKLPDNIVPPAGTKKVQYTKTSRLFNTAPVYQATVPVVNFPTYCYVDTVRGVFILTDDAPSAKVPPVVAFVTDQTSPVLAVAKDYMTAQTPLRAGFVTGDRSASLTFCGRLGTVSTCGDDAGNCPCAPTSDSGLAGASTLICDTK
jgi:hypothetical protein